MIRSVNRRAYRRVELVMADRRREAHVPPALPAGRYTIEAFFVSQKDSSVQWVDDHDFTVG